MFEFLFSYLIFALLILVSTLVIVFKQQRKIPTVLSNVKEFVIPSQKLRFRKRDRFYFYGKRIIRIVKESSKTRRFLRKLSKENYPVTDSEESSTPEESFNEETPSNLPDNLSFFLQGFDIFTHFDPKIFLDIPLEVLSLASNQILYQVGDSDESIYVLQSGKITICDVESKRVIKIVRPGETLSSLLSFVSVLTRDSGVFTSVIAKAVTDSKILKVRAEAFRSLFEFHPEMCIRVVQLIMSRLQRVIFVGLHQYLGLASELMLQKTPPLNVQEDEVVEHFKKELNIEDADVIRHSIEYRTLGDQDTIMTEDSHNDAALVYIISGCLIMSMKESEDHLLEKDLVLYTAYKGDMVGQVAMLTGEANFYTARSHGITQVALLTKSTFFTILNETPTMFLSLAHATIQSLSPLVRQIDFALDWIHIHGGQPLFCQGSETDGTFIVLSGRLKAIDDNRKSIRNEYTRGDLIGIVDVITENVRSTSVIAIRDSELCKIPSNCLNLLKSRYPVVLTRLISILGKRLIGSWRKTISSELPSYYATIALFPSTKSVPLKAFTRELSEALSTMGSVSVCNSESVIQKFGASAFDSNHDFRLSSWLALQEDRNKVIIYECDEEYTKWTMRCLRQADVVFDLALSNRDPRVTSMESHLKTCTVQKELILIHDESVTTPSGTLKWIQLRPWIYSHFHLQAPSSLFKKSFFKKTRVKTPNIHSDFCRLGRHIMGRSFGLVLGGGGARGAAHVGMLKAIIEAGIPIDKIGGVSIGSFICGLWGSNRNISSVIQRARDYFELLTKRPLSLMLDVTYPITSFLSGSYFNRTLLTAFDADLHIEDLWIPFYCVSTNITLSRERIHRSGLFWKYCRASMSYAWILPPFCDPEDGHLLMDGCYVNNVPGDIMANNQCKNIIAIDVAALDDRDLTNYGDYLSGWWVLWKRIFPFGASVKIPSASEIQLRLAFCSHYKNLEQLKSNPNYDYIQPPVDKYSPSSFNLFNEIYMIGYHHGRTYFTGLQRATTTSRNMRSWNANLGKVYEYTRGEREGEASFTDYAGIMENFKPNEPKNSLSSDEEENEDDLTNPWSVLI